MSRRSAISGSSRIRDHQESNDVVIEIQDPNDHEIRFRVSAPSHSDPNEFTTIDVPAIAMRINDQGRLEDAPTVLTNGTINVEGNTLRTRDIASSITPGTSESITISESVIRRNVAPRPIHNIDAQATENATAGIFHARDSGTMLHEATFASASLTPEEQRGITVNDIERRFRVGERISDREIQALYQSRIITAELARELLNIPQQLESVQARAQEAHSPDYLDIEDRTLKFVGYNIILPFNVLELDIADVKKGITKLAEMYSHDQGLVGASYAFTKKGTEYIFSLEPKILQEAKLSRVGSNKQDSNGVPECPVCYELGNEFPKCYKMKLSSNGEEYRSNELKEEHLEYFEHLKQQHTEHINRDHLGYKD